MSLHLAKALETLPLGRPAALDVPGEYGWSRSGSMATSRRTAFGGDDGELSSEGAGFGEDPRDCEQRRIRHITAIHVRNLSVSEGTTTLPPSFTLTPSRISPPSVHASRSSYSVDDTDIALGRRALKRSASFHSVESGSSPSRHAHAEASPGSAKGKGKGTGAAGVPPSERRVSSATTPDLTLKEEENEEEDRGFLSAEVGKKLLGPNSTPTKAPGRSAGMLSRRHTSLGTSLQPVKDGPPGSLFKKLDLTPLPPFNRRRRPSSMYDPELSFIQDGSATPFQPSSSKTWRPVSTFVTCSYFPSEPSSPSRSSKGKQRASMAGEAIPFYASYTNDTASTHPIFAIDELERSSSRLIVPAGMEEADLEGYCKGIERGDRLRVTLWAKVPVDEESERGKGLSRSRAETAEEGYRIVKVWDVDLRSLIPLGRDSSVIPDAVPSDPNILILHLGDSNGYFLLSPSPYLDSFLSTSPISPTAPLSRPPTLSPARPHSLRLSNDEEDLGYGSDPEANTPLKRTLHAQQVRKRSRGRGAEVERKRRERELVLERSRRETRMKGSYGANRLGRLMQVQAELDEVSSASKAARKVVEVHLRAEQGTVSFLERENGEQADAFQHRRQDIRVSQAGVTQLQKRLTARRQALAKRRDILAAARQFLTAAYDALASDQTTLGDSAVSYSTLQASISQRRAALVSGISSLFPIDPVPTAPSGSLLFSIRGVPLPNSVFSTSSRRLDNEGISTALGWTAAAVRLLASYLDVALMYPLTVVGSRSVVEDKVSSLIKGPRVFPLYARGLDRHRFEYGVFLLNKDVEQIMYCRNLLALDLRHTLPNLKNLVLTAESVPTPSTPEPVPTSSAPQTPSNRSAVGGQVTCSASSPSSASSTSTSAADDASTPSSPPRSRSRTRSASPTLTVSISRSRASSRSEKTITLSASKTPTPTSPTQNGQAVPFSGKRRKGTMDSKGSFGMNGDTRPPALEGGAEVEGAR